MIAAPAAVLAYPGSGFASPNDSEPHDGHEADDAEAESAHAHARERTEWPRAEGAIPASPKGFTEVSFLLIEGTPDFDELEEMGVEIAGKGTWIDPYVLEGLNVRNELEIKDTDDYYVIRENWIDGTLRLNWNGDKVHVHHNHVNDLRVNENIERKGDATGGLVELNEFGVVGQIRHFDGVFRANAVGPAPDGYFDPILADTMVEDWFTDRRVLNVDGFDGAIFEDNTIKGYTEIQLHGHHHASCFDCHSHNHGDLKKAKLHDHTIRYHEIQFVRNTVEVEDGVALRYTDEAHAGDDRTARSEEEESLEKPHVHFTRILFDENAIRGGSLVVDVFNADDENHANEKYLESEKPKAPAPVDEPLLHGYRGDFVIRGNTIALETPDRSLALPWMGDAGVDGLSIRAAKEMTMLVEDNEIAITGGGNEPLTRALPLLGESFAGDYPAVIRIEDLRGGEVEIRGNRLSGAHYGIAARDTDAHLWWTLAENAFENVKEQVHADESVENAPTKA